MGRVTSAEAELLKVGLFHVWSGGAGEAASSPRWTEKKKKKKPAGRLRRSRVHSGQKALIVFCDTREPFPGKASPLLPPTSLSRSKKIVVLHICSAFEKSGADCLRQSHQTRVHPSPLQQLASLPPLLLFFLDDYHSDREAIDSRLFSLHRSLPPSFPPFLPPSFTLCCTRPQDLLS